MMTTVPQIRITRSNHESPRGDREYVLYWMTAFRRTRWNFSLQRAVEWAVKLKKPLVILETLHCDSRWAADRFHRFVMEGMAANHRDLAKTTVLYYPFVERKKGQSEDLLPTLSQKACVVVTDEYPISPLPAMVRAAAEKTGVLMEKVDSNGLLPLRATNRLFKTAYSFRRFLQTVLPDHLEHFPAPNPLSETSLPRAAPILPRILKKWPLTPPDQLQDGTRTIEALPIDHRVIPSHIRGGQETGRERLNRFVSSQMNQYHEKRNHPDEDGTSGLSPYLHFGHVSPHQVASLVLQEEEWSSDRLSATAGGRKAGWWGVSEGADAFLDELITWREIGFNACFLQESHGTFESLPEWAQTELTIHAQDQRPHLYSIEELESARTHNRLWNAAQTQLLQEGRMHNYLRMVWGKKILQWTDTPQKALQAMIHLNNKYALDGSDPNSYTGIFWVLGKYDRPWGPARPIFGKVRYMSTQSTLRKLKIEEYLAQYGD